MIYIVPIRNPVAGIVDHLMARLSAVFATPVEIHDPGLQGAEAFDTARHQYNSTTLLTLLMRAFPGATMKVVGVTNVDLYIPALTFVYGEAQLGGSFAVASSHRLRNAFYGLPEDRGVLFARFEKEVVHELGHTYNLVHCEDFNCVMYSTSNVSEIDVKSVEFCPSCRRQLEP